MTTTIVQWTTGNVGKRSVRAVVAHPDLELIGCYAWSPDKVGRDVGELCGIDSVGITASNDIDGLLRSRRTVSSTTPCGRIRTSSSGSSRPASTS